MKTQAITFLLTTSAPEREVECLAAEIAEDAREHLRDGEHLELDGVADREDPAGHAGRRSAGA